jgi:phage N-6-adenine-methyltransferase
MSAIITQHVEQACTLLAQAKTIHDAKELLDKASAMEMFLRRRDAASEAHGDAWEIVQLANRRLGELCRALPQHATHGGRPKKTDSAAQQVSKGAELKRLGVTRVQASRWEKLAELAEKDFLARVELGRARITKQIVEPSSVAATSAGASYDGDEWCTPREYIEAAREVLGGIELDPATNARAQKLIRAKRFYTKADNALDETKSWRARSIWLNPPYSHPLIEQFTGRLIRELAARNARSALVLVNNTTDTAWFHELLERCRCCLTRGRIAFELAGVPMTQTRQGQAFFYAGTANQKFARVFGQFGKVLVRA